MNIKNLKEALKTYLHEEDLKPFKFTFDLGKGRVESFIDYGVNEEDAKANLLKNTRYLQGEEENIIKVEPVKEDHEEVTLPFTMIHRSSDGPDASGEVTFFPTAFGYEYKCTEDDFNGRGPQWSIIRTIEGIKIWFRNVLFEFGAKIVTIGNETWDIDDLKKNESITKIKKYNRRKIKETCMNMKNLLRTINRALNEDVESNYHIVGYIGDGSDARSELLDTADTLEEAKEIAKEIYRMYKNSHITDNRSVAILDGKDGDTVWYIDRDCEEKLNESFNEDYSMEDFNESLQETADRLKGIIDKIVKRYEYRTLENVSYDNEQARQIVIKLDEQLRNSYEDIYKLYDLIG